VSQPLFTVAAQTGLKCRTQLRRDQGWQTISRDRDRYGSRLAITFADRCRQLAVGNADLSHRSVGVAREVRGARQPSARALSSAYFLAF
jgi:hypothetical protein